MRPIVVMLQIAYMIKLCYLRVFQPPALNFLGIGSSVEIRVLLSGEDERKREEIRSDDGQNTHAPIYYDGETISGQVTVIVKRGSRQEHQGIRIEFVGAIEFCNDRSNRDEFICVAQDLARPGILSQPSTYPFEFLHLQKPYETYSGTAVRLRYHLQDVIIGKICFLLVGVKLKMMEVQILKKEIIGSGPAMYSETEALAKHEIMDGLPVKGESIPFRLFLHSYNLSPTMRDVNRRFSVRYFLNLVLLDEDDRRYYKHQEIILYRKPDKHLKSLVQHPVMNDGAQNRKIPSNGTFSEDGSDRAIDSLNKNETGVSREGETASSDTPQLAKIDELDSSRTAGEQVDTDGETSCSSGSPRARRSMHRYEPAKQTIDHSPPCLQKLDTESPSSSRHLEKTEDVPKSINGELQQPKQMDPNEQSTDVEVNGAHQTEPDGTTLD